ncbi:type II secretion system protein [Nocardioides ungokensis]|uniref:type II secretion system protein n=1 Tax=Nocardioides ungokensis TaxID=1643322 RepID=UPI0015E02766|nr:type II secretion system protein [Nocardioides ungokensis]
MSRFPETDAPKGRRDDGFTLIEVMVAMGIFLVVSAAILPLVVAGFRTAATARDVSQTKGVAQAQIEKMRDLPYYVGRAAGDYKDLLDTYYRDRNAPGITPSCASPTLSSLPPTTWEGYVSNAGTHCSWEPTGPLYRKVVNPVSAPGLGVFAMTISTQFLSPATPPVAVDVPSTYTSQTAGQDAPPSSQVGVTIAVFYKTPKGVRYNVTYTQVEQAAPINPLITSEAKATTVRVSSALDDDNNLLEQLGVINLSGELFSGSRVVATASSASAGSSLGQQIAGASMNLVAPVDTATTSAISGNVTFPTSGCTYQCFGDTKVDQVSALANNGLPRAGTATAPIRAMIPASTNNDGFRFSNGFSGTRLMLDTSKPMVSLDTSVTGAMADVSNCVVPTTGSGNASYLTGSGFLNATATSVASCGTAQSNTVRLFPTTFAPKGVVQVVLDAATASCSVSGGAGVATAGYRATVKYWNGSTYTTVPALNDTNTVDPLDSVNLGQSVASGLTLGDYISSWGSAVTTDLKKVTTTKSAEVSVPAVVSIVTKPTRENTPTGTAPHNADLNSAISLDIGAVSCQAGDYR